MQQSVFLITPPFTQLNTPYPATAYLKGFLNTKEVPCAQADLGIEVINAIFSRKGLLALFQAVAEGNFQLRANEKRIVALQEDYINTIEPVILFFQDKNPTLAHSICTGNYLPEAKRFEQVADLEWAFGTMGIRDKARHLATLYLEDIGDLIKATVDPFFGFSRYAERLASSAHSFDELYTALQLPPTFTDQITLDILDKKLQSCKPTLLGISVPFPGNLYGGLRCAKFVKEKYPDINICMGGGYANTELRSLKDTRVFEFLDFITLDDGEACIYHLVEYLEGKRGIDFLKRSFSLADGAVYYFNASLAPDYKQIEVGTPDYEGLPAEQYLSVIEVANPMHRLWSDGRWNKLTLAHGCYWGKCTFCDISLDYIKNYEATTATVLADRIETIIAQTGETGFHFVDEAAPPALMRELAIEILKRKITITWWTNIRFEKSFSPDLCRLLAASGCIAVSGGLEVASDRLLALIKKGVTLAQVAKVTDSFTEAGIMVHAYLMYGFPTQTDQETIDSLEVVRQMFEANIIQSGFWHQFAMTAHSPVGMNPEAYKVKSLLHAEGDFANNDIPHLDDGGADHSKYAEGLRKALFNYMHGICFEFSLQEWFDFKIKATTIAPDFIQGCLEAGAGDHVLRPSTKVLWTGHMPQVRIKKKSKKLSVAQVEFQQKKESIQVELPLELNDTLQLVLQHCSLQNGYKSIQQLDEILEAQQAPPLDVLFGHAYFGDIQAMGLYLL
ncbi:MAG: radical SAM protein [Bacteroidetes bacterium 43-16]|nr:MAG: radical SAM protein [Bacteroidetes bacterium 43-16]